MSVSTPVPGQRTGIQTSPRTCLASLNGVIYGRGTIDATYAYDGANTSHEDELRPGTIMAQLTSGLWVPCKRTVVATGNTGTVTSVVVTDARAFKVGDVISIDSDTSITITAIDYTTNTLTIASTALVDADVVKATTPAGSDVARGILDEFIKLKDEDGVARNKSTGRIILAGMVYHSMLLGDATAIRAATTMKWGQILFTDDAGQA